MSEKETELRNNNEKTIPTKILIIITIAGLLGFVCITYAVTAYGVLSWDDVIRNRFYQIRKPGLTTLMELVTYGGEWPAVTALCLLLILYPSTRKKYGIPVATAAIVTQIVEKTVKHIVMRPRPDISVQLVHQGGYSFPSGHSISSFAVYFLLFVLIMLYMKKGGKKTALLIITAVLAFGVGLSRIYLGVHFPSDVAAGWCGGLMVSALVLIVRDNTKIGRKYMQP